MTTFAEATQEQAGECPPIRGDSYDDGPRDSAIIGEGAARIEGKFTLPARGH